MELVGCQLARPMLNRNCRHLHNYNYTGYEPIQDHAITMIQQRFNVTSLHLLSGPAAVASNLWMHWSIGLQNPEEICQVVMHWSTTLENVTALPSETQNPFSW